jgi:hypothetical protein
VKAFDFLATILVGLFLIMVVVRGNTQAMFELAKRDREVVKWGIALGALFYIREFPQAKGPVDLLITGTFMALFLLHYEKIESSIKQVWNSF